MKAIICDTCGKIAPDSFGVDIVPLTLRYDRDPVKIIERDICPKCVADLIAFFEPEKKQETAAEVTTLEAAGPYNFDKEEAKEISDFIHNSIIEASGERPDESDPGEAIEVCEQKTTFEVEQPKEKITKAAKIKKVDITELELVNCEYCKKPFTPRSKKSKFCTHYCENHNWMDKQKLKNETQEQKKIRTDELLQKLKRENPIREIKEPNIYREM